MKKLVSALIGLLAVLALSISLVSAQSATPEATAAAVDKTDWPATFIIGVYPGDNVASALQAAEPLRAYLEAKLGVHTVVVTGTSYGAVVEAMAAGRADAFEVGPLSYLLAANIANAEAVAVGNYTTTVDTTTLPGYYSLMFTKKGSGIKTIDDLKGKTFAFTDPASTSGYLIPAMDVLSAEKFTDKGQLDTYFAQATFAGSHPASVLAVVNGTTDAGATFDDNLADQVAAGTAKVCGITDGDHMTNVFHSAMTQDAIDKIYADCPDGDIAVFHQSPIIPQTPFAVSKKLPQSFRDAVKDALLALKDDQTTVDALGRFYVDPTAIDSADYKTVDGYYDHLRDIATTFGINVTTPG